MKPDRCSKWLSIAGGCLFILSASPAHAQVASLGKGWLLASSSGSITSAPSEVISGKNSIKGSYSGTATGTTILYSDSTFVQFAANQRYAITLNYRILSTGSGGFSFGFFSPQVGGAGPFVSVGRISGTAGSSGTASLSATLFNFPDYVAGFKIDGTGAIAIDDIRITDANGQLVASENAEGPSVVPGSLNWQLTDAVALLPPASAFLRSAAAKDLDGDGYPEIVFTVTDPNNNSSTPLEPIIVEASHQMRVATADFFPTGLPTVKHSPITVFADLNGDGLQDIVFSDSGSDPTGPGSAVGVALNLGGGKFRNVQPLIPADQQSTRSYAVVVGDVLSDGHVEILLPDKPTGANTALLRWNGNGFDEIRNWILQSLWQDPVNLRYHNWMNLADFDRDGKQDLLLGGQQNAASIRIAFGGSGGFSAPGVVTYPDGPWGHTPTSANPPPTAQGAEVQPIVVADFNNDGLPDIFAAERKVVTTQPGSVTKYTDDSFQILINQGARKFVDVTAPNYVNLGDRTYFTLLPIDINNDGFLDVVGLYDATLPGTSKGLWGTTFFLNDGTGAFQVVDGTKLLAVTTTPSNGVQWNLGSLVPTVATPQRTEGIVAETVGGCGGPGFCPIVGLNIYKVVANGSIGTGPNFADSAALGVPGFNESYYLNHYPDAAATVQAGQFKSGLDHYIAVGAAKGYRRSAPNNAIPQGVSVWSDNKNYRITYQADGNVVVYDTTQTPLWFTNTTGTTPGTFVMQSDGNLVLRDGQNVVRWQSGTTGNPGASFAVQGDGNLVIFNAAGQAIWGAK